MANSPHPIKTKLIYNEELFALFSIHSVYKKISADPII